MDVRETWEILSYIVTVVGLPFAIAIFIYEQRRERKNEEEEIFQRLSDEYREFLKLVLDNADLLLPREVPEGLVTMYSQVLLADQTGEPPRKVTLCYPADAEPSAGFVSVLSPLGVALLGARKGDTVTWGTPARQKVDARVVDILFQPEASGDYTL